MVEDETPEHPFHMVGMENFYRNMDFTEHGGWLKSTWPKLNLYTYIDLKAY